MAEQNPRPLSDKPRKTRIDQLLVDRGLAESRSRAQALILAGLVFAGERKVAKAGETVLSDAAIEVRGRDHPWVSRGGIKLAHALDHFGIDVTGMTAIDVGSSTGGFTDVLVTRGARLRGLAVLLFFGQLALNLAWPIYFFRMHQVSGAFYLLVAVFVAAFATTIVFGRIRPLAAWLMVPYLAWLCFASVLNKQIDELNPNAEQLVVPRDAQRIQLAPPSQ